MAALFAQSITQFASLRTCARIHTNTPHSQLIRELFPKALFDEQKVSYKVFMKIAWSFLSSGIMVNDKKYWRINQMEHRIGGLPAAIYDYHETQWYKDGKCHRDDKDPQNKLTLPAIIYPNRRYEWYKDGNRHRDDKDPRTGLILPAMYYRCVYYVWCNGGNFHRDDKDPQTGLTLPAMIFPNRLKKWYKDGYCHRDDIDPQTGLNLPAVINGT